jgi:hypothetical protein
MRVVGGIQRVATCLKHAAAGRWHSIAPTTPRPQAYVEASVLTAVSQQAVAYGEWTQECAYTAVHHGHASGTATYTLSPIAHAAPHVPAAPAAVVLGGEAAYTRWGALRMGLPAWGM